MDEAPIVPGRACGTCTLCCKILSITELAKPKGQWCRHCDIGRGCRIYDQRPPSCRTFICGYLGWPVAGDHWFPARCKMVIIGEESRLIVRVDPSRPNAWREQPYYDEIKDWSAMAVREGRTVLVVVGESSIVVLPDGEVELGLVAEDERIVILETRGAVGPKWTARKLKADDPELGRLAAG